MPKIVPIAYAALAIASVVLLAGYHSGRDRAERLNASGAGVGAQMVDRPALDFELRTLDGGGLRLSDLRGKLVFLNFWATWCPPCLEELPAMAELAERLKGRPFEMVAVSQDEDWDALSTFFKGRHPSMRVALDPTGGLAHRYGTEKLPETYVIGRSGQILSRFVNAQPWSDPRFIGWFESVLASGL
jgi:peroxiredoxin